MDLASFTRANKPSREQMIMISDYLVKELESLWGMQLSCFKRHIVDGESSVATVQGILDVSEEFSLSVEAVVLVQMRTDQPPNISAEVLMFSRGERVGIQRYNGRSYLLFDFDTTQRPNRWSAQGWVNDGPDDWESISCPRSNLYGEVEDSWEDND